jgi:ribonuclease BN (tRNA processing enzyme)
MELTVLGNGGTWPKPGGATSGYLLRHEGFNLWVDAGTGTFAELQRHVEIGDIDAVLVTHGHPDHFVDIYPCFYARHYGGLGAPGLPLVCPVDFHQHFAPLVSEDGKDVAAIAYDIRETPPGQTLELGPMRVQTFEMAHIGVRALGYRIEAGDATLAYTGDTGPCEEMIRLAKDADVLLSEATWQDSNDLLPFHLSARQAAEHAEAAGARTLLLTHIWPTLDPDVSLAEASEAYHSGTLALAEPAMRVEVGR